MLEPQIQDGVSGVPARVDELQSHVAELLSKEQELIQARIKLDRQVDFYRGLNLFNKLALRISSIDEFTRVVTEQLVAMFEVEIAAIKINSPAGECFAINGFERSESSVSIIKNGIGRIEPILSRKPSSLNAESLASMGMKILYAAAVMGVEVAPQVQIVVLAGNTEGGARFHSPVSSDWLDALAVYTELAASHLGNLIHQAKLRENERQFRAMFDNAAVGMSLALSATGQFIRVNKKLSEIIGFSEEELLGMTFLQLTPPEARDRDWQSYQSVVRGESKNTVVEKHYLKKNGSLVWVKVNIGTIFDDKGKVEKTISVIEDVSHLKWAEDTLRLRGAALESAANTVMITNVHGIIEWVNPAFTKCTGYGLSEVLGKTPRLLKSGEQGEAFYKSLWQTILKGDIWKGDLINLKKNGEKYIDETIITPVKDDLGRTTHFIAIQQDVTSRKKLEADFLQAQKMEAIGKLAGGIAHDFNNNLSVILGFTGLLKQNLEEQNQDCEELSEIENAAKRSADLTRQLLAFTRRQLIAPTDCTLNDVINSSEKMLRRILGENVFLTIDLQPELPNIRADVGNLNQIIMNLVVNARDAMPDGGSIFIATKTLDLEPAAAIKKKKTSGTYVCLRVADTGCGMSESMKSQIFEPFFTTKGKMGTGLGLSVIYGIVEQHSGWIEVSSQVGEGTVFEIFFPISTSPQFLTRVSAVKVGAGQLVDGVRILIVEDEPSLNHLAKRHLQRVGCKVLVAQDKATARSVFLSEAGRVDVLFTDIILPDGNGFDLAKELSDLNPKLKVLLTSGYTDERSKWGCSADANTSFLPKPYMADSLIEAIKNLLSVK